MQHLSIPRYTKADQRSDTSFLVGSRYGKSQEKVRLEQRINYLIQQLPSNRTPEAHGALDAYRAMLAELDVDSDQWLREVLDTRLAPIIELQKDLRANFFSSHAKRLGRAIAKTRRS